jgi:hypothetical protein
LRRRELEDRATTSREADRLLRVHIGGIARRNGDRAIVLAQRID